MLQDYYFVLTLLDNQQKPFKQLLFHGLKITYNYISATTKHFIRTLTFIQLQISEPRQ